MRTAADLQAELEKCEAKARTCTFDRSRKLWIDKAAYLRKELELQEAWEAAGSAHVPAVIEPKVEEVEEDDPGPVLEPEIDLPLRIPPKEPEVKHLTDDQFESLLGLVIIGVVLATIYQFINLCLGG